MFFECKHEDSDWREVEASYLGLSLLAAVFCNFIGFMDGWADQWIVEWVNE